MVEQQHLHFRHKPPRIDRFVKMIDAFERDEIETAVDALIACLDARDGDPDEEDSELGAAMMYASGADPSFGDDDPRHLGMLAEDDGDTADHNFSEDDFRAHDDDGPGCPIADSDTNDEDARSGDTSWTEWHTRSGRKNDAFGAELVGRDRFGNLLQEEDEADDPDTGIDDRPHDAEEDMGIDDQPQDDDGCDAFDDDTSRDARRPHRDRIRRTRCDRIVYPVNPWTGRRHVEYRLREDSRIGGRDVAL